MRRFVSFCETVYAPPAGGGFFLTGKKFKGYLDRLHENVLVPQ
jgi:hypothetical protein